MKKIVITGGHLTPALALIEALPKKNWQILFIGRARASEAEATPSMEAPVIKEMQIPFRPLNAGRIQRHFTRWTIPSILKIPLGFVQAFIYLWHFKPNVILSFGGYLSSPVVFAAWLLQIPVLTHEQTTVKGLATRFNALFAKIIAVSWTASMYQFPQNKVVLTGNPIRSEILKTNEDVWKALRYEKGLPLIFITGGNQGGHVINKTVEKCLLLLTEKANVFHQCGHLEAFKDYERLTRERLRLPAQKKRRYHVKKYLNAREMGTFLNKADLVIARAGANTITELAVLGKPCLLIPLPGEQTQNAQLLFEAGTAEILAQDKLAPENFLRLTEKILKNLSHYQKNSSQAEALVETGAAQKIVRELEKMAR
jgi:UDP-N-acetylglucosamine--N-acetylmuramyl-(pentapeptide) pyrophosphoryl-undecaprenol N-acetylglucosamine transferase